MTKKLKDNTVLIIEDDLAFRTFTRRVLELERYRVLEATTGEEGLKLLRDTQVNLVLLDLKLPDINGWTVLEHIKSETEISAIPVIILTASVGVPQQDPSLATDAAYYLTKPMSVACLKSAVARILKSKR